MKVHERIDILFDCMFDDAINSEAVGSARVTAVLKLGSFSVWANNSKKSHPFQKRFGKNEDCIYLHAEIAAIKEWIDAEHPFDPDALKKAEMYVMRAKRAHKKGPWVTGLAKPCPGCQRALATFEISKVFYTEDNASEFTAL